MFATQISLIDGTEWFDVLCSLTRWITLDIESLIYYYHLSLTKNSTPKCRQLLLFIEYLRMATVNAKPYLLLIVTHTHFKSQYIPFRLKSFFSTTWCVYLVCTRNENQILKIWEIPLLNYEMNGIAKSRAMPIHFFNSIAQSHKMCVHTILEKQNKMRRIRRTRKHDKWKI